MQSTFLKGSSLITHIESFSIIANESRGFPFPTYLLTLSSLNSSVQMHRLGSLQRAWSNATLIEASAEKGYRYQFAVRACEELNISKAELDSFFSSM